jgi:DNA-binding response OmpR family regulator
VGQRQLLVLGNLKGAAKAALEVARRDAGYECISHPRADEAIQELDSGEFRAMLVDLTTPGAARFCHEARARRALFNVPLIALSPKLTDLAFSNALRWGADDVVMLGAAEPLRARLDALPEKIAPIVAATRGEAVIADPERSRCDVLGRVLANAGFNVKYATDAVATRFYLGKPSVSLFVINAELGDVGELASEAAQAGSQADWVITTKSLNVEGDRAKLQGIPRLVVMSSHGPPENVLFALNLLHPNSQASRRAEVRALHGAITLFRPVGLEQDEYGFTYSVSSGGLYVRTLLPCPSERLWLELTPPNVPRRVKLLGELVWSRTFGEAGAETAPPGFGVRIMDGLGDDLELWQQGFRSLDIRVPTGGVPEVKTSSTSFRVPLPSNRPPKPDSRAPAMPSLLGSRTARASKSPVSNSLAVGAPDASRAPKTAPIAHETMTGQASPDGSQNTAANDHHTVDASDAATNAPLPEAPPLPRGMLPIDAPSPDSHDTEPNGAAIEVPKTMWHAPEYTPRSPVSEPPPPHVDSREAVLSAMRASLAPHVASGTSGHNAPNSPTTALTSPGAPGFDGTRTAAMPAVSKDDSTGREDANAQMAPSPSAAPPRARTPLPPPITLEQLEQETSRLPAEGDQGGDYLNEADLLSVPPGGDHFVDQPPAMEGPPPPAVDESTLSEEELSREQLAREQLAQEQLPPPPPVHVPKKKASAASIVTGVLSATLLLAALFLGPRIYETLSEDGSRAAPSSSTEAAPPTEPPPTPPRDEHATAAATGSAPAAGAKPATTASPSEAETTRPSPPSDGQSAAEPAPTPAPDTPPAIPPAPDPSNLSESHGYLYVSSSITATVFVHGVEAGKTNQWLESRCGFRFIRLGKAPGQWLSEGLPTKVRCRKANRIELQPN